jgi:hypothetical protein
MLGLQMRDGHLCRHVILENVVLQKSQANHRALKSARDSETRNNHDQATNSKLKLS